MSVLSFKYYGADLNEGLDFRIEKYNILQLSYYNDLEAIKATVKESPHIVNIKDDFTGRTPLHIAASLGNYSVVKFLLSCPGVDARSVDFSGRSALELGGLIGHAEIFNAIADAIAPGRHDCRVDEQGGPNSGGLPSPQP